MQYYDTSIQDAPVKDVSETKVRVWAELERYPTSYESDVFLPFVEGINPDADADGDIPSTIEIVRDDDRHKHIRVRGLPVKR